MKDKVKITSPPNTFINHAYGSIYLSKCGAAYFTDYSESTCTLSRIDTSQTSIILGLNAHNNAGAKSSGTLTIHGNGPPAYGDLKISAQTY